jgi:integrase
LPVIISTNSGSSRKIFIPAIEYFIGTLINQANFNIEQDYLIHRARTRHNGALKRVGKNLKIEGLSGHVPRHTLANHMAYSGRSEEEIRQVLAHSTVRTTKVYLRERHGFSGSFEIMKKFHEGMKKGS